MAGRFVVRERAGSGGMGTGVPRRGPRETGLPVALKVLRDKGREDTRRFEREARLLSRPAPPEIVRHVAHGITGAGEPWLAMEWLPGEDLGKRLRRGVSAARRRERGARARGGRGARVRSRSVGGSQDLKPTNIFLVGGEVEGVTLLDSVSHAWPAARAWTRTGTLLGTPATWRRSRRAEGNVAAGRRVFVGMRAVRVLDRRAARRRRTSWRCWSRCFSTRRPASASG